MLGVNSLHRQYANVIGGTHENYTHHESSQAITNHKELQIQGIIKFIEDKGSPLCSVSTILQNFVTIEIMPLKGTVKAEYNLPLKYCISIVIAKKIFIEE